MAYSFPSPSVPSTKAGAQEALNKPVVLNPGWTLESPEQLLKNT